jgi:hypothetical protein
MKTFIYGIFKNDTNELYYLGSTTRKYFCSRKSEHKKFKTLEDINRKGYIPVYTNIFLGGGWPNFTFKILHETNKLDPIDRCKLEQEFVLNHRPLYNKNKAYCTVEERKENLKKYYKDFIERNPNYIKDYYNKKKNVNNVCMS